MSKRLLTYFILALVVFQSTAGIADIHQSHQSGTKHVTFDDHQHLNESSDVSDTLNDSQEADCHHCCHCHGYSSPAVFVQVSSFVLKKTSTPNPDYTENLLPKLINPVLRPPILNI